MNYTQSIIIYTLKKYKLLYFVYKLYTKYNNLYFGSAEPKYNNLYFGSAIMLVTHFVNFR